MGLLPPSAARSTEKCSPVSCVPPQGQYLVSVDVHFRLPDDAPIGATIIYAKGHPVKAGGKHTLKYVVSLSSSLFALN